MRGLYTILLTGRGASRRCFVFYMHFWLDRPRFVLALRAAVRDFPLAVRADYRLTPPVSG